MRVKPSRDCYGGKHFLCLYQLFYAGCMELTEKLLYCVECQKNFIFSISEQKYYQEKGFLHPPKRCKQCRPVKTFSSDNENNHYENLDQSNYISRRRKRWQIVCSACGCESSIPFAPKPGRALYCPTCYKKLGGKTSQFWD